MKVRMTFERSPRYRGLDLLARIGGRRWFRYGGGLWAGYDPKHKGIHHFETPARLARFLVTGKAPQ